jgi:hypothetical protein
MRDRSLPPQLSVTGKNEIGMKLPALMDRISKLGEMPDERLPGSAAALFSLISKNGNSALCVDRLFCPE